MKILSGTWDPNQRAGDTLHLAADWGVLPVSFKHRLALRVRDTQDSVRARPGRLEGDGLAWWLYGSP